MQKNIWLNYGTHRFLNSANVIFAVRTVNRCVALIRENWTHPAPNAQSKRCIFIVVSQSGWCLVAMVNFTTNACEFTVFCVFCWAKRNALTNTAHKIRVIRKFYDRVQGKCQHRQGGEEQKRKLLATMWASEWERHWLWRDVGDDRTNELEQQQQQQQKSIQN